MTYVVCFSPAEDIREDSEDALWCIFVQVGLGRRGVVDADRLIFLIPLDRSDSGNHLSTRLGLGVTVGSDETWVVRGLNNDSSGFDGALLRSIHP